MTRSTNMEHVEVLLELKGRVGVDCSGVFLPTGRTSPEQTANVDAALDTAIAALSAPRHKAGDNMEAGAGHVQGSEWVLVPREKLEQVVDGIFSKHHNAEENKDAYDVAYFGAMLKDVEEMLATDPQPPAEAQPVVGYQRALELIGDAYNAGTHGIGYSQQASDLFDARTAPPSAPVGVEVKVLARDVHYAIRDAGLAPESPADDAAMRDAILRTLAQQPAAVDEAAKGAEIESLRAEVARLQEEIDNRWARGEHTCHDKCQRTACVLRRDNERLAEALREAMEWNWLDDDARPSPIADLCDDALRDHDQEDENDGRN